MSAEIKNTGQGASSTLTEAGVGRLLDDLEKRVDCLENRSLNMRGFGVGNVWGCRINTVGKYSAMVAVPSWTMVILYYLLQRAPFLR